MTRRAARVWRFWPVFAGLILASCDGGTSPSRDPATAAGGEAVRITGAWCRAAPATAPVAACYATLTAGSEGRLTAVSSPAAEQVEIHTMDMAGGIMRMRPVEGGIELPAGQPVALQPGGQHLMLTGVKAPMQAGGETALTFSFASGPPQTIAAPVRAAAPEPHGG